MSVSSGGGGGGKGEMLWSVNLALVEPHAGGRRRESFLPHSALSPAHLVPRPPQTLQLAPFYAAVVALYAHVGRSAGGDHMDLEMVAVVLCGWCW